MILMQFVEHLHLLFNLLFQLRDLHAHIGLYIIESIRVLCRNLVESYISNDKFGLCLAIITVVLMSINN
jgi:hypothetical protein